MDANTRKIISILDDMDVEKRNVISILDDMDADTEKTRKRKSPTNLPCCWMWNMRSPPFRYSITKKRWD